MPGVTRIPLAYNNVYVLEEPGRRILVDTGPDYRGAAEAIGEGLAGRAPDIVVATHGHLDHAGLGLHWQSLGVPVAAGVDDRHLVSGPALADDAEFRGFVRYIEDCGAPPGLQAGMLAAIEERREWSRHASMDRTYPPAPPGGRWPTGLRYLPFTPERVITAAGPLNAGSGCQVLLMPGHTPGNLVLTLPEEGWLFSGDQLLPEIAPTPAIQRLPDTGGPGGWRFHSLPHFAASLRKLATMQFTRCFPGHGEPFDNVGEAIAANLSQIEQRAERVLECLRLNGPSTLFGLSDALYPRAAQRRPWQILATVQGHLDVLVSEGRARLEGRLASATG